MPSTATNQSIFLCYVRVGFPGGFSQLEMPPAAAKRSFLCIPARQVFGTIISQSEMPSTATSQFSA